MERRPDGPWYVIYFLKSMTKSFIEDILGGVLARLMPSEVTWFLGDFPLILGVVRSDGP